MGVLALAVLAIVGGAVFMRSRGAPVASGPTWVAYEEWVPDGPDSSFTAVRARNLDTGATRDVGGSSEAPASDPAVSGSRVYYAIRQDVCRQLVWLDLDTGERGQVLAQDGEQADTCAQGDVVAWILAPTAGGATRAVAYDMGTEVRREVAHVVAAPLLTAGRLVVDVYSDAGEGGIVAVDLRTGARRWVARGGGSRLIGVSGGLVLYRSYPQLDFETSSVHAFDLATGELRELPFGASSIYGDRIAVVRRKSKGVEDLGRSRIEVDSLSTGKTIATIPRAGFPTWIGMRSDWVVWLDETVGGEDGQVVAYNLSTHKKVAVTGDATADQVSVSGD